MKKIRILGLAPNEGMNTLMKQAVAEAVNSGINILFECFTGEQDRVIRLAQERAGDGYDGILTYGTVAQKVRQVVQTPVVEAELTPFDVLRALQLSQDRSQCVLIGYPGLIKCAGPLKDVLGYIPPVYPVYSAEEARDTILGLVREGDPLLICDHTAYRQAMSLGIKAITVSPGKENFVAALTRESRVNELSHNNILRQRILQMTLSEFKAHVIMFGKKGEEVYRSEGFPEQKGIVEKLYSNLDSVLEKQEKRFVLTADGVQYDVTGIKMMMASVSYVGFTLIPHTNRLALERYGIKFRNAYSAQDEFYNSLFGISQSLTGSSYEKLARTGKPAMVIGEVGTGKTEMTTLLHNYGPYHNAPICIIDCNLLKDKGWNYLMYNENSPLFSSGITIHFRQIPSMETSRFNILFDLLHDTHIERRNQIIFCRREYEQEEAERRYVNLSEWFSCSIIRLKQLKENRAMIPQLANMFINSVNSTEGTNIMGVDPEGMRILQEYDWPANHDQFRRVLRVLSVNADSIITSAAVRNALEYEKKMYGGETTVLPGASGINTDGKTMEEIMLLAVRNALRKHNNNQTAAAAELGINRTSLWRMAQKYDLSMPAAHDKAVHREEESV